MVSRNTRRQHKHVVSTSAKASKDKSGARCVAIAGRRETKLGFLPALPRSHLRSLHYVPPARAPAGDPPLRAESELKLPLSPIPLLCRLLGRGRIRNHRPQIRRCSLGAWPPSVVRGSNNGIARRGGKDQQWGEVGRSRAAAIFSTCPNFPRPLWQR